MDRATENQEAAPSRTAIWAAAGRALGARSENPVWRNPDHLAETLLGPAELDLIGNHALAVALREGATEAEPGTEVAAASATLLIRTRFIDERLEASIDGDGGAKQLVFLGAGFDTRSYRLQVLLKEVKVFEVDHPSTQQWKRRRAQEALGDPPANLTYVPVDFRYDSLAKKLAESGYDSSVKTFFVWEGVTMYLPEEAIRATLRWVGAQAPGSALVFDFAAKPLIDMIEKVRKGAVEFKSDSIAAKLAMNRARQIDSWGEPWIFGIPVREEAAFLESCGLVWRETLALGSREAAERYLGGVDNTKPSPPIREMYLLTEAVVPE